MSKYDFSMLNKPIKGRRLTESLDNIYKTTPDMDTAALAMSLRDRIPEDDYTQGLTDDEVLTDAISNVQKLERSLAGTNPHDKLMNFLEFTPERQSRVRGKLEALAPLPDVPVGAIVPLERKNGEYKLAIPGIVKSMIEGVKAPGQALKRELTDIEEMRSKSWDTLGLMGGGGLAFTPKGAMGSTGSKAFFSQLEETLKATPTKEASPQTWRNILSKGQVKPVEMQWSGIDSLLNSSSMKLTKDEIMAHLAKQPDTLKEVWYGGDILNKKLSGPEFVEYQRLGDELESAGWEFDTEAGWTRTNNRNRFYPLHQLPENIQSRAQRYEELVNKDLEFAAGEAQPPRHSSWTLPGGKNYRELVFTEPMNNKWDVFDSRDGKVLATFDNERAALDDSIRRGGMFDYDKAGKTEPKFKHQGHWGDLENPLVHIRMNDRIDADGKKVLHIEEIQSDWAQQGRKEGFADPNSPKIKEYEDKLNELKAALKRYEDADRIQTEYYRKGNDKEGALDFISLKYDDPRRAKRSAEFDKFHREYQEYNKKQQEAYAAYAKLDKEYGGTYGLENAIRKLKEGLPKAPFVENTSDWVTLAMKKMMNYAAENGYDRISWTTGEHQIERYGQALRKQVDEIHWEKTQDGVQLKGYKNEPLTGGVMDDVLRNANAHRKEVLNTKVKGENNLSDSIGKAMSDQILKSPDQSGVISGDNITIDKGWPRQHYDRMIVDVANKLGKKHGSKVGKTSISGGGWDHYAKEENGRWYIYNRENNRRASGGYPSREAAESAIDTGPYKRGTKYEVHSLDITPSMKSPSALFSKGILPAVSKEEDE